MSWRANRFGDLPREARDKRLELEAQSGHVFLGLGTKLLLRLDDGLATRQPGRDPDTLMF
jgi:hypothetical protein